MKKYLSNLQIINSIAQFINKHILLFFVLALLLRIIIAYPYYSGDVNNHIAWGKSLVEKGFNGFYQRDFASINIAFPTYGPIGMLPFGFFYFLFDITTKFAWNLNLAYRIFHSNLVYLFNFENQNMLAAYLKLPAIFGDLLVGVFIYLFAKNIFKLKNAALFPVFYLFNPATFYLSANWGQIDSLSIAFAIGAFYFLFREKVYLASTFFIFSILTKQTALIFLPIFLIILVKNYKFIQIGKSVSFWFILFWLLYLPFFITKPFTFFSFYLQTFSYITNRVYENAFNFWYFLFPEGAPIDSIVFLGLSARVWGSLIFGILVLPSFIFLYKKTDPKTLSLVASYLIFAGFMFQTRIHERYFAFLLPFLLLSGIGQTTLIAGYVIGSMVYFINLYNGFFQPNITILTRMLSQVWFIRFLISINFLVFFYLLIQVFKELRLEFVQKKNGKT